MKHSKVLKREDGSRIEIVVTCSTYFYSDKFSYGTSVFKCEAGKRKFTNVHDSDDYAWRRLDQDAKKDYVLKLMLEHVTKEEIYQAELELWEKMKPKQSNL